MANFVETDITRSLACWRRLRPQGRNVTHGRNYFQVFSPSLSFHLRRLRQKGYSRKYFGRKLNRTSASIERDYLELLSALFFYMEIHFSSVFRLAISPQSGWQQKSSVPKLKLEKVRNFLRHPSIRRKTTEILKSFIIKYKACSSTKLNNFAAAAASKETLEEKVSAINWNSRRVGITTRHVCFSI